MSVKFTAVDYTVMNYAWTDSGASPKWRIVVKEEVLKIKIR